MSRVPIAIAAHTLDTANVDELCFQLGHALKMNIEFGFPSAMNLDEYLPQIDLSNFETPYSKMYCLNKATINPNWERGILYESDYQFTWLYETFGEKAGAHPEFKKIWGSSKRENLDIIKSFMGDISFLEFESKVCEFNLYEHTLCFNTPYNWRSFSEYIVGLSTFWIDKKEFMKPLNSIKETALLLGATHAYYFMLGPSLTILGLNDSEEVFLTWDELETEIRNKLGAFKVIDLRKCMNDEKYQLAERELWKDHYSGGCIFLDDFKS